MKHSSANFQYENTHKAVVVLTIVVLAWCCWARVAFGNNLEIASPIDMKRTQLALARIVASAGRCEIAEIRIAHELTLATHSKTASTVVAPSAYLGTLRNIQKSPSSFPFDQVVGTTRLAHDRCAEIKAWALLKAAPFVPRSPKPKMVPGWVDKVPQNAPEDHVGRSRDDYETALLERFAFATEQHAQVVEIAMEQVIAAADAKRANSGKGSRVTDVKDAISHETDNERGEVDTMLRPPSWGKKTSETFGSSVWRFAGPAGITNGEGFDGSRQIVSGRVTSLARVGDSLFVGSALGGVWRTDVDCTSWSALSDRAESLAIGAVGSTSQGKRLLAPTGEGNIFLRKFAIRGDRLLSGDRGAGILISDDGGASWRIVAQRELSGNASFELLVSRSEPDAIAVATSRGLLLSYDAGETWRVENGNFQQSIVTTVISADRGDNELLVGVYGEGVYKVAAWQSTTPIWSKVTNGLPQSNVGRIQLASSFDGVFVYALIATADHRQRGLFVSVDSGVSWESLTSNLPDMLNGQGFYNMLLVVDPSNSERIFVGGSPDRKQATSALYRGVKVGTVWKFAPIGSSLHTDFHAALFDRTREGRLFVANDGGVWRTDDWGDTWKNCNQGLGITQILSLDFHESRPLFFVAGTQDNGTIVTTDSESWVLGDDGDGGYVRIHPSDASLVFNAFKDYRIAVSKEGGKYGTFAPIYPILNKTEVSAFAAPYELDPDNKDRVLLGTQHLHFTSDGGKQWRTLSHLSLTRRSFSEAMSVITRIARLATDQFAVGTSDGKIWLVTESSEWTARLLFDSQSRFSDSTYVADIVHLRDTKELLVAVVGSAPILLRCSTKLDSPCQTILIDGVISNAHALAYCAGSPDSLYVGTDVGVSLVNLSTGKLRSVGLGLPRTAVFQLHCDQLNNRLVAGTFGRGVWQLKS